MYPLGLVAQASNIKRPNTTQYTLEEFHAMYPQFEGLIPEAVEASFLQLANACVSQDRYGAMWNVAIALFMAHFLTLWLQSFREPGTPADEVMAAAQAQGVVTSESADGLSYSMDTSMISQDLAGWGAFKLTTFGVQFASMAKLVGKGGMYIY